MMWPLSLFDGLLGFLLLWLAWRVLASKDLFKSVVLFIIFGLLMAMAWVRLKAPDIALAEAAIGTGLTGVLLLDAVGYMRNRVRSSGDLQRIEAEKGDGKDAAENPVDFRWMRLMLPILVIASGVILVWVVLNLPGNIGLSRQVEAGMEISGVAHPVTAVLLNFRSYDTLLEIGVLLLAVFGVYSLRRPLSSLPHFPPSHPILLGLTRLLVPLMVLVGGYLFWSGAYAPGGAFQAGAVLGAAGVLLQLNGIDLPGRKKGWPLRVLLMTGFGLFLGVAGGLVTVGNRLLEYPRDLAGGLIVLIEAALTLSIAFVLTELFAASSSSGLPPSPPTFLETRKDEL